MSCRTAVYYVHLVVRSRLSLEQAIDEARELDRRRHANGFDQAALNEAARQGFANGAFEELDEDVPAVVDEFYSEEGVAAGELPVAKAPISLGGKLEAKVPRTANG